MVIKISLAERRYERSGERRRMGKALVQRHVALPEDLANREGKGLLVSAPVCASSPNH